MTPQARLHLAFDMTAAPAKLAGGGHYMRKLAGALAGRSAVRVTVFARAVHRELVAMEAPSATVLTAGPDARPLRLLWEQVGLPLHLRRLRPDVLHSPHYTMPLAASAPVVVTFHDATFFTHPELHEPTKVRFFRTAMKIAARRAARIVVVSAAARDALAPFVRLPADRVDVVHEGVDLAELYPPPDAEIETFRSRFGISGPYIAFLGTLEPRKNLPRLVAAFAEVARDWDGILVLAGQRGWGNEELDAALEGVPAGRVREIGYVAEADRRALLGGSEMLAYPSVAEGFGLPAIEAMAAGTPVLTSRVSATAEVAGEAAVLVDPLDVDGIATALRRILSDSELAAELRDRGAARAREFTWDRVAEQMEAVYRRASRQGCSHITSL